MSSELMGRFPRVHASASTKLHLGQFGFSKFLTKQFLKIGGTPNQVVFTLIFRN
jgi:hypothetical protein